MNWAGPAAFFAMGGYASYVWGAFLVTAVLIAAELLVLRRRRRTLLARLSRSVQSVRS